MGSLNSADGDQADQVVHLWERTCVGGMNAGDACAADGDCDGGTCAVPIPTCDGGAGDGFPCQSLELCVALDRDGLTPPRELVAAARDRCRVALHVLIRCRPGDFVYGPAEIETMLQGIVEAKGDTLKLAYSIDKDKRPKDFDGKEGFMFEFKKAK